jgi:3-oxoacyl-[acyl-carrier protein] reductase
VRWAARDDARIAPAPVMPGHARPLPLQCCPAVSLIAARSAATIVTRMEIRGKAALVTGGARRVGRALALGLADAGADVVVNYNASGDEARATVAEIEAKGGAAVAVQADVSRAVDVERLVREAERALGRLDILVNSASLFERAPVADIDEADWDRVLA